MKSGLLVVSGILVGLVTALFGGAGKGIGLGQAEAQAGPAGGATPAPTMVLGTGGGSNNVNDLCWVLSKVKPVRGPERTVLALYRAKKQGETFDLEDVRMIDVDLRVMELNQAEHKKGTTLKELIQKLPPEEQAYFLPPRNP